MRTNIGNEGCTPVVFGGLMDGSATCNAEIASTAPAAKHNCPNKMPCRNTAILPANNATRAAFNLVGWKSFNPRNVGSQRALNPHTVGTRNVQAVTVKNLKLTAAGKAGLSAIQGRQRQTARLYNSTKAKPMVPKTTHMTQIGKRGALGFSLRCPRTEKKNTVNAASSSAAEMGSIHFHCHSEMLVNQRRLTPAVQSAQHHQPRLGSAALDPRILGMEYMPMPRMNVPIHPKICACPCAWIHGADGAAAWLMLMRFHTPRNVPGRNIKSMPVTANVISKRARETSRTTL